MSQQLYQELFAKRSHKRFKVDPIRCQIVSTRYSSCTLRDLSIEGAYFESHYFPPIGFDLMVEISEGSLQGYGLHGVVVRHENKRTEGFALRFKRLHPKLLRLVYYSNSENSDEAPLFVILGG